MVSGARTCRALRLDDAFLVSKRTFYQIRAKMRGLESLHFDGGDNCVDNTNIHFRLAPQSR